MASKTNSSLRSRARRLSLIATLIISIEAALAYHFPQLGLHLFVATFFGTVLSFAPFGLLRRLGQLPGFSPNAVSCWRALIGLVALPVFFRNAPGSGIEFEISFFGNAEKASLTQLLGLSMVAISLALDRTDGRIAEALKDLRSEREKQIGAWLDPLMDKVTFLGAFTYLWYFEDNFSTAALLALFFTETVSTVIRPPFVSSGVSGRWNSLIGPRLKTAKATAVGKIKVVIQFSVLLLCIPEQLYHIKLPTYASPTALLWVSVLFSVLSTTSRLRLHKQIDEGIDQITKEVFDHEDI